MKKLISLLMVLLLVLTSAIAFAETEGDAASTDSGVVAPAEGAETPDVTPDETEGGDEGAEPAERNLLLDGLTVSIIGLAGVFLVLILFFLMIKIMGKMLK